MSDHYLLPNGTLRNKLGEMNAATLAQREGQIVAARELQLRGRDSPSPRSLQALRAIHRHLFQDIYDWAGEFRTIDLMKEAEVGGPISAFTPCRSLAERCREIDGKIQALSYLQGLSRSDFAAKAAEIFVDVNRLHPFREGNGRTQRLFMEEMARGAGHRLDFGVVTRERMIAASIAGHQGDVEAVRRLFLEISDSKRVAALRKVIDSMRRHDRPPDDLYIATTVAGQSYAGRFAGRSGSDFMLRVDEPEGRVLVGDVVDLDDEPELGDDVSFVASRFGPG